MRAFGPRNRACDRAREAASLRLDGELSQLEGALLDRHLARCPECAAFAADTAAFTHALRRAEPVAPETPLQIPLRRRGVRDVVRASGAWTAAASVAATALLVVMTLPTQHAGPGSAGSAAAQQHANQDLHDLRILRMAQLKPPAESLSRRVRGQHGEQLET
jgi:predicted anti-sigma-YlaC factor YlaD